jgi:hypothetical protein
VNAALAMKVRRGKLDRLVAADAAERGPVDPAVLAEVSAELDRLDRA